VGNDEDSAAGGYDIGMGSADWLLR